MKTTASGVVNLSEAELPFSCPPPKSAKWDSHPRVFLPLTATRREHVCPYCGTRYVLRGGGCTASGGG